MDRTEEAKHDIDCGKSGKKGIAESTVSNVPSEESANAAALFRRYAWNYEPIVSRREQ